MNEYESCLCSLEEKLSQLFAVNNAIREIKNNPDKYPEFDFWKPGYDAEEWTEKALVTYKEIMGDQFENTSIVVKLIIVRHYRKLAQKWRKASKGHLLSTKEFAEELVNLVVGLHPELFNKT